LIISVKWLYEKVVSVGIVAMRAIYGGAAYVCPWSPEWESHDISTRTEKFPGDSTLRARHKIKESILCTPRSNGVIPFAIKIVTFDVDLIELLLGHLDSRWIETSIELATNSEARLSLG
jgi:hypothetical protein